ncbi:hypothetical protein CDL15_Pgr001869 [Punica granatum]|uniref:Uncharacterized protein n=1 Tax=Punica granatum TaxID=22663 RepID=A0A218XAN0_PUNGR|nr:hypothetical protein CDL15_Pgr001869 [Punica granatum]
MRRREGGAAGGRLGFPGAKTEAEVTQKRRRPRGEGRGGGAATRGRVEEGKDVQLGGGVEAEEGKEVRRRGRGPAAARVSSVSALFVYFLALLV